MKKTTEFTDRELAYGMKIFEINQKTLAGLLGIKPPTISNWITKKNKISKEWAVEIEKIFDVLRKADNVKELIEKTLKAKAESDKPKVKEKVIANPPITAPPISIKEVVGGVIASKDMNSTINVTKALEGINTHTSTTYTPSPSVMPVDNYTVSCVENSLENQIKKCKDYCKETFGFEVVVVKVNQ